MKRILVTNDDGIHGAGLRPLINELSKIAEVITIVPDQERSGMSHSITLHQPLWIKEISKNIFITTGTPVDCVRFGILHHVKGKVDLVVSGINTGPNMGEDVIYSGTVAGARESTLLGIMSFAISLGDMESCNFDDAAAFGKKLACHIINKGIPENVYINVNYPKYNRGIEITTLGKRSYDENIDVRTDPRGRKYYWLSGNILKNKTAKGTDIHAIDRNKISLTPLHLETTDSSMLEKIKMWKKDLK